MTAQKETTLNILLVDDDSSLLELAESILNDMDKNLNIDSAFTVDDAFQKIAKKTYDAIISDYEMPKKNGLDFLKELREKNNKTPFILFTGRGREEIAIQALNLGADRYLNKNGNPETVYKELTISIHQLHEKSKAKNQLMESEERLRRFIENAPDAIFVCDLHGRLLDQNNQAEQLHGYTKEEVYGKNMLQLRIISPEAAAVAIKQISEIEVGKRVGPIEYILKRKDGISVVTEISIFPVKRGKEIEVLSIARDITERKNAEHELEQKHQALERVAESLDSGLAIIGKDYRVVWANTVLQQMGIEGTKHCYEIFNNRKSVCPDCGVKKVFENNVALDVHEYKTLDLTGKTMWVELRVTPLKDKNGKTIAALELAVPIDERKKAEAALMESEERYRMIAENMMDVITISDVAGNFTYASPSAFDAYGYTPEEMIGKNAFEMTHPLDLINIVQPIKEQIKTVGESPLIDFRFRRKDGAYVWIESSGKKFTDSTGKEKVVAVARTTEERKKVEEELKLTSSMFDLVNDAIYAHDREGNLIYFNKAAYRNRGYTKEEMAKINLRQLDANPSEHVEQRMKEVIKKGLAVFESVHLNNDGTKVPVEVHIQLVEIEGKRLALSVVRDIVERKKAEAHLEAVNEKLRVVGKLTRHDIRNKLSTINSTTYLLKRKYANDPELIKYLSSIDSSVAMANRLFDFTALYEKIGAQEQTEINIKSCFDEAVALFPNLVNIKILNDTAGLVVIADSLLRQVFYNLIDNSLKHGQKVTQIKLYYLNDGNQTRLLYEDNGVGVSMENKPRIFSERFTTGNGTGLGLSTIKKMMDVYNWTIQETGIPDTGVKFEITIPSKGRVR